MRPFATRQDKSHHYFRICYLSFRKAGLLLLHLSHEGLNIYLGTKREGMVPTCILYASFLHSEQKCIVTQCLLIYMYREGGRGYQSKDAFFWHSFFILNNKFLGAVIILAFGRTQQEKALSSLGPLPLLGMPDVQTFFHEALAVIIAKLQYLYTRRNPSASSIKC